MGIRTAAFATALSALVALAGCGWPGNSAVSGSPTATASPLTIWAGAVCSSAQDLRRSAIGLTGKITISAGSSQSSLSQAKQQLKGKADDVKAAASALTSAASNPPVSTDAQVRAAQQNLKAVSDQTRQAVNQVTGAARKLQSAGDPASLTQQAAAFGAAAVGAISEVGSLLGSIKQYASGTGSSVDDAFASAPSCHGLLASS